MVIRLQGLVMSRKGSVPGNLQDPGADRKVVIRECPGGSMTV